MTKKLVILFISFFLLSLSNKKWVTINNVEDIAGCWQSETSEDVMCIGRDYLKWKHGPKQKLRYSKSGGDFYINAYLFGHETLAASVDSSVEVGTGKRKIKLSRFDGDWKREVTYFKVEK